MALKPWRYLATIWRASPEVGVLDPDLGTFTVPDARRSIYEGRALVQDAGPRELRNVTGVRLESDAEIKLQDPHREFITLVQPGDQVEITYPDGRMADGEVVFARELDATVEVKYL